MENYQHLIISLSVAIAYLLVVGKTINIVSLAPWIIGGVMVDLDHLLTYMVKIKTINPKRLIRITIKDYHKNNQHFYMFHSLEFAVFLAIIVERTRLTWHIFVAYMLHLFCDGLRHRRLSRNFSWLKKWSFYLNFIK